MDHSAPEPALALLPEVEVRRLLASRTLAFRVLRPPFAAIGIGVLRLLRVAERDGRTEIVAGYDGYERIEDRDRASAAR